MKFTNFKLPQETDKIWPSFQKVPKPQSYLYEYQDFLEQIFAKSFKFVEKFAHDDCYLKILLIKTFVNDWKRIS